MRRAFTKREKVMIIILAVIILAICYFKLMLEPINEQIESYQTMTETEQTEITQNQAKLASMKKMQKELDEIYASNDAKPLPTYDNADVMLTDLNKILSSAKDYTLSFGGTETLEEASYIMRRPVSLVFYTDTYAQARDIIDELHDSENINQISDVSISMDDDRDNDVTVTLSISYFEVVGNDK